MTPNLNLKFGALVLNLYLQLTFIYLIFYCQEMRFQSGANLTTRTLEIPYHSGLVPNFSNLDVCVAFPAQLHYSWQTYFSDDFSISISINNSEKQIICRANVRSDTDHLWLIYGQLNVSNPCEQNHNELEVTGSKNSRSNYINRLRLHVECICCPRRPDISCQQLPSAGGHDCGSSSVWDHIYFLSSPQLLFCHMYGINGHSTL